MTVLNARFAVRCRQGLGFRGASAARDGFQFLQDDAVSSAVLEKLGIIAAAGFVRALESLKSFLNSRNQQCDFVHFKVWEFVVHTWRAAVRFTFIHVVR